MIVLGVFLLRHRNAARWTEFWPMALLQVAWTNSHSAFILGPVLVALFGIEMTVRRSLAERRIAWPAVRIWAGGVSTHPPGLFRQSLRGGPLLSSLLQGGLESIRAYVSEMEPFGGTAAALTGGLALTAAAAVVLAMIRWRGAVSWSFLFLALALYFESLAVLKSWPVFGLFPPLLILSCGAFGPARPGTPAASLAGNLLVAVVMLAGAALRLSADSPVGLPVAWREYDLGRRELPYAAVRWMKKHGIEGRLFHRCEEGGLLQAEGYDRGETFGDTGFGKYDERLIRLIVLPGERPALLPLYLAAYRPGYVVLGDPTYRWRPFYLRREGWRPVFYSPYGAVWTRPETRPDLPTVTDADVEAVFARDLAQHGRPADVLLFGRNLVALNSDGHEDFVFAQLAALPPELHRAPWYWEAARILCFETPRFSEAHRRQLLTEAEVSPEKIPHRRIPRPGSRRRG